MRCVPGEANRYGKAEKGTQSPGADSIAEQSTSVKLHNAFKAATAAQDENIKHRR
jgi:hypothetical protein